MNWVKLGELHCPLESGHTLRRDMASSGPQELGCRVCALICSICHFPWYKCPLPPPPSFVMSFSIYSLSGISHPQCRPKDENPERQQVPHPLGAHRQEDMPTETWSMQRGPLATAWWWWWGLPGRTGLEAKALGWSGQRCERGSGEAWGLEVRLESKISSTWDGTPRPCAVATHCGGADDG